jgi:hypothetical protein
VVDRSKTVGGMKPSLLGFQPHKDLLGLFGQYWAASSFSTLRWREKTLPVAIPYWGSSGSLNLLVDSTGIKAVGEAVMCQFARLALDKKLEAP